MILDWYRIKWNDWIVFRQFYQWMDMNYEQILKEHVKKEIFITFEMLMHHGNHSIWQFLKHSSKCEESLTNTKMVTSKMRICRGISIHSFYRSLSRTNKWFKAFLSYLGHNVLHLTVQYSNIFSYTITSLKFYCNKYIKVFNIAYYCTLDIFHSL